MWGGGGCTRSVGYVGGGRVRVVCFRCSSVREKQQDAGAVFNFFLQGEEVKTIPQILFVILLPCGLSPPPASDPGMIVVWGGVFLFWEGGGLSFSPRNLENRRKRRKGHFFGFVVKTIYIYEIV